MYREVSAYSKSSVRRFLRETKEELDAADHYNLKAREFDFAAQAADDDEAGFYFISYAWEPPSRVDARRGRTSKMTVVDFWGC